ncbi:hypothetical protein [Schumannella soli]|uniref:PKD domain-containing protein n=1 Tax=Schumannella soli TaxID=2590779 RepID=A0A506Y2X2_9MICO|nr:hypothetical protein [Schumannella soli]TPW75777.1 hypothetical protein FJ657_07880 [Schumannella soli]
MPACQDQLCDSLALEAANGGPITVSDIATFIPQKPTARTEPKGWGVRGLDTNFIGSASTHTVTGTLLGATAQVRFAPTGYRFDYGDGSSVRSTKTGGATWAKQGLRAFDPTPTSHVYRIKGTYAATVSVVYRAEYRVDGMPDWVAVQGTLTIPADAPLSIRIADATTVLVDKDCRQNPSGPGCGP